MTVTALDITESARKQARAILRDSKAFHELARPEQEKFYRDVVQSISQQLSADGRTAPNGNGRAVATQMAEKKASDLINDERYYTKRIDQLGQLAGDFMESVDFPTFVQKLLKAVFDANLKVTVDQMNAYGNLLKLATSSVGKFIKDVDDTAAFGYLAENDSDNFSIDFDDEEKDPAKNPDGAVLTDKDGTKLDLGDNEVKAKVMDAKIAMAREQRAMLREMLLMGVTRLVVQRGNVKAGVIFDFKATETVKKSDKAALKESSTRSYGGGHSTGWLGRILGGSVDASYQNRQQSAQITVSSAKGQADTSLQAKLTGSVDITFISDYFKLDNFAAMYGPQVREALGGTQPAIPAAATPAQKPVGG